MDAIPFEHGKIEQDGTYRVVTDYYVAESKEDIGGTEITSDIEYNYGTEWVDSDSILTADAVVKTLVQGLSINDYGVWDSSQAA